MQPTAELIVAKSELREQHTDLADLIKQSQLLTAGLLKANNKHCHLLLVLQKCTTQVMPLSTSCKLQSDNTIVKLMTAYIHMYVSMVTDEKLTKHLGDE